MDTTTPTIIHTKATPLLINRDILTMAMTYVLVVILLIINNIYGKVISGVVSSSQASRDHGTFITKFCFHDKRALFKFETNTTSSGRWYFYLDENWQEAVAETDCNGKLSKARFSIGVSSTSGEQFVNQWSRPHFWYVVYAEPGSTCSWNDHIDTFIGYTLTFLNPDTQGVANDHFGEDEKGLLMMYALLVMFYIGGISLFARSAWKSIQKAGPMHEMLQILSVSIFIHFLAIFFMLIHLWVYKNNGEGSTFCETFSEILDVISQLTMVAILLCLSVGWTIGSSVAHNSSNIKQILLIIIAIGAVEIVLVLWEQSYDESHYTYHVHENLPGVLLIILRILITVLFGYNLNNTMNSERSTLRKDFYKSFSHGCYLWFLSFPILMFIAVFFPQYWRHRVVTIGTIGIQSLALLLLSRQFLSRSLYWEVSTLSSTTLPFKRDRGDAD